jgi:tetratricopeptide (TPR) repeat protein
MTKTAATALTSYYTLFDLRRDATPAAVEAAFRRAVARYRAMTPVMQLVADPKLLRLINAYLTLHGAERAAYDAAVAGWKPGETLPTPEPYGTLPPNEQQLFLARIAYWRREMADMLHLLRQLTERDPQLAPAWALMGEFYLTVDRVPEGIRALEKAVAADPGHAGYAARLQHARDAEAGRVELQIEPSPEEELLREERRARWKGALAILILGSAITLTVTLLPPSAREIGLIGLPWLRILGLAFGLFVMMLGLGYGRILPSFEQVMIRTAISASDRGYRRSYPYALIMLVTAFASLWLSLVTLFIMAATDEEWPAAPSILIGLCILATAGLATTLHVHGIGWQSTAIFGGNLLVVGGMLGWWFGSLGTPTYD